MENINFRGIPTSLFLNGPKIEIVTDPQNENSVIGVATFTGIATAIFIDSNFDFDSDGGGSIAFKWYFDGSLISDYCDDVTSNAKIVGFDDATGTGSTITISGLTADDYGKSVYFEADYIPSAYSLPTGSQVRAGSARSTGNAFNEPVKSLTAQVFPLPLLEVVSNPKDQISVSDAEFSVVGEINPDTIDRTINYQWQLDEVDIVDGSNIQTTVSQLQPGTFTITGDDGSSQTVITSESTVIDNFKEGVTYTLSTDTDTVAKIFAKGAGGGASGGRSISGGKGGFASGTFKFVKNQEYKVRIGGAGQDGAGGGAGGFSGGGTGGGGFGKGGGGGGFTGLFIDSITFDNALVIAGGGGGGSNAPATGGDGGGLIALGASNESGYFGDDGGGGGGTQFDGGSSDIANGSGSELQGGTGAAGGGGGYYGGGGGNPSLACAEDGAGGGGSSYIGGKDEAQGQAAFTTPGTYTWIAPSGVTSVSVVCVGGGGGGSGDDEATGGYGGGLGWKNNISVIPGQGYLVVVGSGGKGNSSGDGEFGDPSYFINLSTVGGLGGPGGSPSGMSTTGGDFVGDGGGLGGGTESINIVAAAGGGAGGYSGNGGFARNNNSGTDGEGGGGGAGQDGGFDKDDRGGGGGGVGILGQGENGKGGGNEGENIGDPGEGGSGGTIGVKGTLGGHGGSFGGGGGQLTQGNPGNGGDGAVRIIWGSDREFPSTNTEDLNSIDTVSVINGETTTGGGSAAGADGSLSIVVRGTEIESLTQTANLSFSGATTPNLTISSSGGSPPTLVGTSIVESDNGVATNATKTKFAPGTKGGPQTQFAGTNNKNELGGFTTPDQSSLLFMGSYSSTLKKNRSATWSNVQATNATEIRLLAIRGNDHNGGERPNNPKEFLSVQLVAGKSNRTVDILTLKGGDDGSECAWNEYVIPLIEAEKVSYLQISIKSKAGSQTEFSPAAKAQFSENISKVYANANDAYGVNWIRLYNGDTLVQDLTFNTTSEISGAVRCKLSTNDVVTSPVFSDHASYIDTPPTNILKIEEYRYNDEIAILHDFDLEQSRESEVVCISVLDEASPYKSDPNLINVHWNAFRKNYPKRPFWLLQPEGGGFDPDINLPDGWDNDSRAKRRVVSRNKTDDWFNITNLDEAPPGTIVSLIIDQSGSMEAEDVVDSLVLFRTKCEQAGIPIRERDIEPSEQWIPQHNKDFKEDLTNALIIDYDTYPGNAVCLYARDQDINVQMELHGGKGANNDNGSKPGGNGGYSKITLTMKKGEEYMITGLFDAVNAPFVYRKGTLIAVTGEGGDAGTAGKGGGGGGINIAGEDGGSNKGGKGGVNISSGSLPPDGIFGSRTTLTPVTQDSKATGREGGRTLPCTRGVHWRDRGRTPCEDLGEIKFRTPNGTELSNTAVIERGYKSGYNIIQTKGKGETDESGDGGSGATGGNGGNYKRGGGGGSGYTDGSVTVVETESGGSGFSVAKVVIRLV